MASKVISFRLSEDEIEKLGIIAERENCSKTQVIREALRQLFNKHFETQSSIELSDYQFQALLAEMKTPPSKEVAERRRHLMEFRMWE